MAVDPNGNVFVMDMGNNRVQKFTNDGSFVAAWGSYGSGQGQFIAPEGVAVDASGNLFVVDSLNSRVQEFAPCREGDYGCGDDR